MTSSKRRLNLFVAVNGSDAADGTRTRPLATLRGAREAIRRRRQERPVGPVTVWIGAGTYRLSETLVLEEQDSGVEEAPVVWRACPGAEVRISGGCSIEADRIRPVSDPAVRARFDAPVRDRLREIDLRALGILETGGRTPLGFAFGFAVSPADMDLYDRDQPLPVARWPRTGYAAIGPVSDPGTLLTDPSSGPVKSRDPSIPPRGATFAGDAERIRRWSRPRDLACFGMWARDWAPATKPVKATDPERGTITLDAPSYAGVIPGQHYYVRNALEEIAQPGDWAVDREAGRLYLDPPAAPEALRLMVSVLPGPLIDLRRTRWITLRDLTLEGGRFHGVTVEGEHNTVAGCVLRNLGGRGVSVDGRFNRIQSCDVYQTGQGGIFLSGGDRRSLEPGENVAENCEIHDFNRVCTTYHPAVLFSGCGNAMRHNRIYDGPHNAILLWGNDHRIEFNEISHMGLDTDDAAAFYMGRNPSEQGNVIRHNYFHHIGSPSAWGTSAIYPDDGSSGLTVEGNIFYRCGHDGQVCMGAVFNNGGKDHRIENNIFVDCRIAFGNMLMLAEQWLHFVRGDTPATAQMAQRLYEEVDIRSEVYLRCYPWLAELESRPSSNIVRRNLAVRCGVLVTPEDRQVIEDNWMVDTDPGFRDLARLNFALKSGSRVMRKIPGFQPIPVKRIGLFKDVFRRKLPDRAAVDIRPEVAVRPEVCRPGDWAAGRLVLHLVNAGSAPASGRLDVWSSHPEAIRFQAAGERRYELAPGETRREEIDFEACAQPDRILMVGVRDSGTRFALPVPVRFRYRVEIPRVGAGATGSAVELPFIRGAQRVGVLALAIRGGRLELTARADDLRACPETGPGNWSGPYVGLLAADVRATSTAEVHQVVLFPHGPGRTGTVQYFIGHREEPAPAGLEWAAAPAPGGWTITAAIPLTALGLTARSRGFRLEAMINGVLTSGAAPVLTTLFGSKTARLELKTLADVAIKGG